MHIVLPGTGWPVLREVFAKVPLRTEYAFAALGYFRLIPLRSMLALTLATTRCGHATLMLPHSSSP